MALKQLDISNSSQAAADKIKEKLQAWRYANQFLIACIRKSIQKFYLGNEQWVIAFKVYHMVDLYLKDGARP